MPLKNCLWLYLKLSFFSATPSQVPWSWFCILKSIILYLLISAYLLDDQASIPEVVIKTAVDIGVLAFILYIGLKIIKKPERFHKSLSALIGIGLIISAISVPLYAIFTPGINSADGVTSSFVYLTFIIIIWNLAVISNIFKQTFECSTLLAATVTFNYFITLQLFLLTFFSPEHAV